MWLRSLAALLAVVLLWSGFAQPAAAFAGVPEAQAVVLQAALADDGAAAGSPDDEGGLLEAGSGSDESVDLHEALPRRSQHTGISRPYSQPARWTPLPHASPDLAGLQRPPSLIRA